jgi:hypothetical protein
MQNDVYDLLRYYKRSVLSASISASTWLCSACITVMVLSCTDLMLRHLTSGNIRNLERSVAQQRVMFSSAGTSGPAAGSKFRKLGFARCGAYS